MARLRGVPEVCAFHEGIDVLGDGCRIDPSVSVMRWGQRAEVLCLAASRTPVVSERSDNRSIKHV